MVHNPQNLRIATKTNPLVGSCPTLYETFWKSVHNSECPADRQTNGHTTFALAFRRSKSRSINPVAPYKYAIKWLPCRKFSIKCLLHAKTAVTLVREDVNTFSSDGSWQTTQKSVPSWECSTVHYKQLRQLRFTRQNSLCSTLKWLELHGFSFVRITACYMVLCQKYY